MEKSFILQLLQMGVNQTRAIKERPIYILIILLLLLDFQLFLPYP